MLAGCSWSSISALCSSGCPLLRSLDLRYADGVKDSQIRELVTPPGKERVASEAMIVCQICMTSSFVDLSSNELLSHFYFYFILLAFSPNVTSVFAIFLIKCFYKNFFFSSLF